MINKRLSFSYVTNNLVLIFITSLLFFSCEEKAREANLVSPKENYRLVTKPSDFLVDKTHMPDSLSSLKAFVQLENQSVVATKDGIYFIDDENQKLKKYYQLTTEYVLSVKFTTNTDDSKLLVSVSSGQSTIALLFQIHLASLEIDWLATHSGQFKVARYSNVSGKIALGTGYHKVHEEIVYEKEPKPKEYYASLFTIEAETGAFSNYFEQGKSVRQLKFSKNDEFIYAVLDWPHVDTFLWNVANTKDKVGFFGRDQTPFYNAFELDDRYFLTIGEDGLYKWDRKNSEAYEIVYNGRMNSEDKISQIKDNYVIVTYDHGLINPPTVKYFDKKLAITDSVKLDFSFDDVHFKNGKLSGTNAKDEIGFYNSNTKKLEKIITKDSLQQLIISN